MSADIPFQANLFNGLSIDSPCPRCMGDPTANDNVRGGACSGGPRERPPVRRECNGGLPRLRLDELRLPADPASQIATFILGTVTFATGTQRRGDHRCEPAVLGASSVRSVSATRATTPPPKSRRSDADCPISGGNPGVCGGRRCLNGANARRTLYGDEPVPRGGSLRPALESRRSRIRATTTPRSPGSMPSARTPTPTGDEEGNASPAPSPPAARSRRDIRSAAARPPPTAAAAPKLHRRKSHLLSRQRGDAVTRST